MNLTKRTCCIIMALAIVFTTLVFVSVGASFDFPVYDSVVSYSGGSTQNCKQSKPDYLGDGKIATVNFEDVTSVGAQAKAQASNLPKLYEQAEAYGKYILIDLYAEFKSTKNNTRLAAAVDFGAGKVITDSDGENTNVVNPTPNHVIDFINEEYVTLRIWVDDLIPDGSIADLESVTVTAYPEGDEVITGSFYFGVPYVEGSDTKGTVQVTSFKTTTTKAAEKYDGEIAVYDNECSFAGTQTEYKAQWGSVNEISIFYGDYAGYEKKYLHVDASGKQIQVNYANMIGLAELRARAIAEGKVLCVDVYANDFTNGSVKGGKCDFRMEFYNSSNQWKGIVGSDSERLVVKNSIKQTFNFDPTTLTEDTTKITFTFQNYSYGDYANISNARFIVSAPYVEGDEEVLISPSTTTTTAPFKPDDESWDGKNIKLYNSGVKFTGSLSWFKPNTNTLVYGDDKSYFHIDGNSVDEYGGGQIQLNGMKLEGLTQLYAKAVKNSEPIYVDIYAKNLSNSCRFRVGFNAGGSTTPDKARLVQNNKKQTILIDTSYLTSESNAINFTIQNYEFGDKTCNGNFIISAPYLKEHIDNATDYAPSTTTTTTTTTTVPPVDYEEGDLPLKIKDTPATFTGGWANPTSGFALSSDKKVMSVVSANPYTNYQLNGNVSSFSDVLIDAYEKDTNVCIDVYGNFIEKGQSLENSKAKVRVSVGGYWYGASSTELTGDDASKMLTITPNQVYTVKVNAKNVIDRILSTMNTTKADETIKQVESLTVSGDAAYSVYQQKDIAPAATLHQLDNTTVGQYIEYTVTGLEAGTYDLSLYSRDYTQRGVFEVYVNDEKLGDDLDFKASTKSYNQHTLGQYTLETAGSMKIKLVCKQASSGSVSAAIDNFIIKNINEETTTTVPATYKDAAAKVKSTLIHILGRDGWSKQSQYGRFYIGAPYVEGAEEVGAAQGETTTTTEYIPTTTGEKFGNVDAIDFGYVDCKIDRIEWPANGSTADRVYNGKAVKLGVANGGTSPQIGAKLTYNAGTTLKKFPEYLEYAKSVATEETRLAIDVYPQFSMTNNGSLYCHMNTTWQGGESSFNWPASKTDFKLTAGVKYTYFISLDSIPEGSTGLTVYFDSYEYSPGYREMSNVSIIMTAPYLYKPDEEFTTTTTTTGTTTKTTAGATYPYPSENAGGSTRLSIGNVNVTPGGTAKVPVKISNNEGISNATFSVKYNPNNLTFANYTAGSIFNSVNVSDMYDEGYINIQLDNFVDTTENGVVCYLEFDVTSVEGDYPLIFGGTGYSPRNFFNYNAKNVPCSFIGGYVIVDSTGNRTVKDPEADKLYPTNNTAGKTKFTIETVSETYVDNATSKQFNVKLSISGNAGISKAKFTIQYDTSKLEFVSSKHSNTVPPVFNLADYNFEPVEYKKGVLTYNIGPKDGRTEMNSTNNGTFVVMTFKVIDYKPGTYSISFGGTDYNAENYKNTDGKLVPCSFQSGGIKVNAPTVSKPNVTKVALVKSNYARVYWDKVKNASKYEVWRKTQGSSRYVKVGTVKTTYFTQKISYSKKYAYAVKAVNSYVTSKLSNAKTITAMNPSTRPTLKAVVAGSKSATVYTKAAVAGATGYQIQYSTSSKFTASKYVKTKNLKNKITGLKKGKKYYVRIRAYNVVRGSYQYSKWSAAKSVKAK